MASPALSLSFCESAAIAHVHARMRSGAIPAGEIVAVGNTSVVGQVESAVAALEAAVADFKRQHTEPDVTAPAETSAARERPWMQRLAGIAHAVDRYLPSTEVHEHLHVRVKHADGEVAYPVDVTDPFATNVARSAAQTTLFAGTALFVGPGVLLAGAAVCLKRARNEVDGNTRIGLKRAAGKLSIYSVLRMLPATEPVCLLLGAAERSARQELHRRTTFTADGA